MNGLLGARRQGTAGNYESLLAEMKLLRSFNYYLALDLFGNLPIVEKSNVAASEVVTKPRMNKLKAISARPSHTQNRR